MEFTAERGQCPVLIRKFSVQGFTVANIVDVFHCEDVEAIWVNLHGLFLFRFSRLLLTFCILPPFCRCFLRFLLLFRCICFLFGQRSFPPDRVFEISLLPAPPAFSSPSAFS